MKGAGLMGLNLAVVLWLVLLFGVGANLGVDTATNESVSYDAVRENVTSVNEEVMGQIENDTENQTGGVLVSAFAQQYVSVAGYVTTAGFEWGYQHPRLTQTSFRIVPIAMVATSAFYGRRLLRRRRR